MKAVNQEQGVPVRYIGKRDSITEGAYGSMIVFEHGQVIYVTAMLAGKLLKHTDTYIDGKKKWTDPRIKESAKKLRVAEAIVEAARVKAERAAKDAEKAAAIAEANAQGMKDLQAKEGDKPDVDPSTVPVNTDKEEHDETEPSSEEMEQARTSIRSMTEKEPVVDFAQRNFGVNIDNNGQAKLETVQRKAIQLIDQYGVAK